jgi:hypothetical protein
MNTQEILSIVALSLLGLCFLCGLAKMAMKKDSDKKNCDKACSMAIFAAVALVGVSQLLTETEKYCGNPAGGNYNECCVTSAGTTCLSPTSNPPTRPDGSCTIDNNPGQGGLRCMNKDTGKIFASCPEGACNGHR